MTLYRLATEAAYDFDECVIELTDAEAEAYRERIAALESRYKDVFESDGFGLHPIEPDPDAREWLEAYLAEWKAEGDRELARLSRKERW